MLLLLKQQFPASRQRRATPPPQDAARSCTCRGPGPREPRRSADPVAPAGCPAPLSAPGRRGSSALTFPAGVKRALLGARIQLRSPGLPYPRGALAEWEGPQLAPALPSRGSDSEGAPRGGERGGVSNQQGLGPSTEPRALVVTRCQGWPGQRGARYQGRGEPPLPTGLLRTPPPNLQGRQIPIPSGAPAPSNAPLSFPLAPPQTPGTCQVSTVSQEP